MCDRNVELLSDNVELSDRIISCLVGWSIYCWGRADNRGASLDSLEATDSILLEVTWKEFAWKVISTIVIE
jgi:hypothetical protein